MTKHLALVSCMAPNADPHYRALARYLTRQTGIPIEVVNEPSWPERLRRIACGEADLGAVCGAVYVRLVQGSDAVRLLAAPVMAEQRYGGRPIYFADVIVRRGSRARSFDDLRGARWAFNEPESFSGYDLPRAHLASIGQNYFGAAVQSGSHQRSIQCVLEGSVDAAAIDSIVLARAALLDPSLRRRLRVVASLGPSPVPPLVAARSVDPDRAAQLRAALLGAQNTTSGRALLRAGGLRRFVPIHDHDYDVLRLALDRARGVQLTGIQHASTAPTVSQPA